MRTFIAADVCATVALRALLDRLGAMGGPLRAVSPNNLHITLKFLGETNESKLEAVASVVKRVVEPHPACYLRLAGLGAFPNERRPSVVWVGLDPVEPLHQIAMELDQELLNLGFPREERPFTPHLTLLRIKLRPPDELFSLLADESRTDFGLIEISKVQFLLSEPTRGGPKYTQLAMAALRKA